MLPRPSVTLCCTEKKKKIRKQTTHHKSQMGKKNEINFHFYLKAIFFFLWTTLDARETVRGERSNVRGQMCLCRHFLVFRYDCIEPETRLRIDGSNG